MCDPVSVSKCAGDAKESAQPAGHAARQVLLHAVREVKHSMALNDM